MSKKWQFLPKKKIFPPKITPFKNIHQIMFFLLIDAYKIHRTIKIIGHVCKNYNVIFQYPNNMEGHVLYMKLDYKMLHTHAPDIQLVVIISQQVTTQAYF